MKHAIWMVALAILATITLGAAEPEGYGDLRWGAPPPKGWKLAQSGESQIRTEPAMGSSFGATRLESLQYEFAGGRLVGIALFAKDHAGFLALKRELEALYGAPGLSLPVTPAPESCHWEGKATGADLYYLGEGIPSVLFLSWVSVPPVSGAPTVPFAERRLRDRLRLCALLAQALDKAISAGQAQASQFDADLKAASLQLPGDCGGKTDIHTDRQQLEQEVRASVAKSQTAASQRDQLQKEIDRLQSELEARRTARVTARQPSSAAPPPPPPPTD